MLLDETVDLQQYLEENYELFASKLESLLLEYHTRPGSGSTTLIEPYIDEENKPKFDSESLEGSFKIKYQVAYYFGCDDINTSENYEMNWNISIDKSNFTITFEGEPEWEIDN